MIAYRLFEKLLSFVVPPRTVAGTTAQVSPADTWATSTTPRPQGFEASTVWPGGESCTALPGHRDLGGIGDHLGSADLVAFPPKDDELEAARAVIRQDGDADFEAFWQLCESVPRMRAVLRFVEAERTALRAFGVEP